MTERTIFLSDIHLADRSMYARELAWFRPDHHLGRLLRFLDAHVLPAPGRAPLSRLVLLGDTFDTWIVPRDVQPHGYDAIFRDNAPVMERLAEAVAAGVELLVVRGNHDFDLDAGLLESFIPGVQVVDEVRLGRHVLGRHGHEDSLFNTTAYFAEAGPELPIGYFFGRLASTLEGSSKALHDARAVSRYIRDGALTAWRQDDFIGRILDVIFPALGAQMHDTFLMEDGVQLVARDVRDMYAEVACTLPPGERLWRLIDRAWRLPFTARRLHNQRPVAVLGHVHEATLVQRGGRVIANCGAWCQEEAHVVEVEGALDLPLATVRLWRVHEDAALELHGEATSRAAARA